MLFIFQLEKLEIGTKDISQPGIEQSLDQQHRVPTSTEEHEGKLTKVTESAESAAESVSINFYVPLTSPFIVLYFIER